MTPDAPLKNNTVYTINVALTAADPAGNTLSAYTPTVFTTEKVLTLTLEGASVSIDPGTNASMVSMEVLSVNEVSGAEPKGFTFTEEKFISYTINGITTNTILVTIDFPEPVTGKTIFKVINDVYTALSEGSGIGEYQVVDADTITMLVEDNGSQDSDPATGVITDPVVASTEFVRPQPESLSTFGCSMTRAGVNTKPLDHADMMLLLLLLLWYGIARRKFN